MSTLLCREKTSRVKVTVWAVIVDDCLRISGQDIGNACIEAWGKEEYEYIYQFDRENTKMLYDLLSKDAEESNLMTLLASNFNGMHGCTKLREFCDRNGIEYSFFSY